jgi:hypothetical protein
MTTRKRVLEFEDKYSLFDIEIDGIPIWERLRFGVYREIKRKSGGGQAHSSISLDTTDYLVGAKLWFRNLFFRNPYLEIDRDYLFVGHPRRKKQPDGYWWDIYCDPIHEEGSLDSVHFENPYLLRHKTPAKTKRLRYLEFITYTGTIQRKLGFCRVKVSNKKKGLLEKIERGIKEEFGVEVSLIEKTQRLLRNRRNRLWLYENLIEKINPSLVVVVVSYGKHLLIEACSKKGVPVVEIQHGVIYPSHLGYAFPNNREKKVFPDYLLTWGKFWGKSTELPIPSERVIPVGFPYLEKTKDKYKDIKSKEKILFISQGTIGADLSKFALKVSQHPDIDHQIVYKLHPGEYDRWKDNYPWLVNADIEVISSSEPPLYQLFAESTVQVGVGSTAIYEGLAFNLETYIYDCQENKVMSPLIKKESAKLISTCDELAALIGRKKYSFNKNYYFAQNALKKVTSKLKKLAVKGTQYSGIKG